MVKTRMNDVIILLPGMSGSVLQKDGSDIWSASPRVLWDALWCPGRAPKALTLRHDDLEADDLGDGVRATGLIRGLALIPGLVKIVDGYAQISDVIERSFEVVRCSPGSTQPGNFLEFPYDWRRDNRYTARRLKRTLENALYRWRQYSGQPDAKVILVGHSMGGLIARYCLEVLEAWPMCRALITFGTPFRGAPQAMDYLANGYKVLSLDFTEALRSCTSVYQTLPMYPAVKTSAGWARPAEIDGLPQVDASRAKAGLAFYREIEAAETRPKTEGGYLTMPIVGTDQPTVQSARFHNGRLEFLREAPDWLDVLLGGGDGTVPFCSAVPLSLSYGAGWPQAAETHGALQNHKALLSMLRNTLTQLQIRGLGAVRDLQQQAPPAAPKPAISLFVDDVYGAAEPVVLRARLCRTKVHCGGLTVRADQVGSHRAEAAFEETGDDWKAELGVLPSGLYRATVWTAEAGPDAPAPVQTAFAVC